MKRIAYVIALVCVTIIGLLALLFFINGSLEMYPTIEQQEKVRIASMVVLVLCIIVDVLLVWFSRNKKCK